MGFTDWTTGSKETILYVENKTKAHVPPAL